MKRLLPLLCTFVLILFPCLPGQAAADADKRGCVAIPEEIIPLRVPNFEVPILWKKTLGVDGADKAVDLIALADGGFVLIGESVPYSKGKGLEARQIFLARFDINGKVLWEKRNPVKGLFRVSSGVAVKDRLAILSEIESGKTKIVQLDFYSV